MTINILIQFAALGFWFYLGVVYADHRHKQDRKFEDRFTDT